MARAECPPYVYGNGPGKIRAQSVRKTRPRTRSLKENWRGEKNCPYYTACRPGELRKTGPTGQGSVTKTVRCAVQKKSRVNLP